MADGGFNLRKWLTKYSQVRARIETDAKVDGGPVIEEDITYAKSSGKMRLGCRGQKMLGLAWDYEADVISFDLTEIAERTKGLPATKRNTLKLLAGIFDHPGNYRSGYNESKDYVSGCMSSKEWLGRSTSR